MARDYTLISLSHSPIWERQPEEPEKAWEAFVIYKEMEDRKVVGVAKMLGKAGPTLHFWSSKYRWRERIVAFEREKEKIKDNAEFDEIKKMHRRHIRLAMKLQDLTGNELKKLIKESNRTDHAMTGPKAISQILERAVRVERLSRGESTEKVETQLDLSKLSVEELHTLKILRDKARKS